MLPNFLVIGANKAGTTSLYKYLKAHPQIFMSDVKEPAYFAATELLRKSAQRPDAPRNMVTTREAYEELFRGVDGEKAVGEASTTYLTSTPAAERIHEEIPDAKLVAILRNPIERARSAHSMYVAKGLEPRTRFDDAVREELNGCSWRFYVKCSLYANGLSRYYELFDSRHRRVYLYEDFRTDPVGVLQNIFEWLEVDPGFTPDTSIRFNVSSPPPRSALLASVTDRMSPAKSVLKTVLPTRVQQRTKARVKQWNRIRSDELSSGTRQELLELFEPDVRRLETLLDRDLSGWLR